MYGKIHVNYTLVPFRSVPGFTNTLLSHDCLSSNSSLEKGEIELGHKVDAGIMSQLS